MKLYDLVKTHQYNAEVKPLFSQFKKDKSEGKLVSFSKTTREHLLQLWYYEGVPDNIIADLFDVNLEAVVYRRCKVFNLIDRRLVTEELLSVMGTSKVVEKVLVHS